MWSIAYQLFLGPGETLDRQELSGLKCGFRNERKGKVRVEVIVHYDEYDDEREEDAADTLEAHTHKAFKDSITYGIGGMTIAQASVLGGGGGGAGYLPQGAMASGGTPGASGGGGVAYDPYAIRWTNPIDAKPEEETFAQRYEHAMKLIK